MSRESLFSALSALYAPASVRVDINSVSTFPRIHRNCASAVSEVEWEDTIDLLGSVESGHALSFSGTYVRKDTTLTVGAVYSNMQWSFQCVEYQIKTSPHMDPRSAWESLLEQLRTERERMVEEAAKLTDILGDSSEE